MPLKTPFHDRLSALCESYQWKEWAGYYAVQRFRHSQEPEYMALRQSVGLMDVSPLYKYEVKGPDAEKFLSQVTVRDFSRLRPGRVTYCCWCDDDGKVVDDGTVTRWSEEHFRVTAAEPSLHWFGRLIGSQRVTLEDSSDRIAALALQGPNAQAVLAACFEGPIGRLKFFRATSGLIAGAPVQVTRTGYTGDLGYEVWIPTESALLVWDRLMSVGRVFGIEPFGLDALDMTRIEAGFLMLDVDYYGATSVILESRKSSPYEIGLGWTVDLDRTPFVGQQALRRELTQEAGWRFVGLELDWTELEALYGRYDLPAALPAEACREPIPVYRGSQQIGRATSHMWSPILKKQIALASVHGEFEELGSRLEVEHTVEFERCRVSAQVVETPFFNPPRKRKP